VKQPRDIELALHSLFVINTRLSIELAVHSISCQENANPDISTKRYTREHYNQNLLYSTKLMSASLNLLKRVISEILIIEAKEGSQWQEEKDKNTVPCVTHEILEQK
jgi:hypothetical protein